MVAVLFYRKLEQEHKDRVVSLRADLSKEVELVQQQANQQREELEQQISRIREDETYLREHLTLTVKVITIISVSLMLVLDRASISAFSKQ